MTRAASIELATQRRSTGGSRRLAARLAVRAPLAVLVALLVGALVCVSPSAAVAEEGIHRIKHVVMIMQENRSFDSYFGTYPGANGIPAGVCVPDPLHGGCVKPFHDPNDENFGGPHSEKAFAIDLDGGKMDGFVGVAEQGLRCSTTEPGCSPCSEQTTKAQQCVDPMGYHDAREIPNYWKYAENFVLQDNMYESVDSWSWPEHLYLVSGWSANCPGFENIACVGSSEGPPEPEPHNGTPDPYTAQHLLPWTDITYLMHVHKVSWAYYVFAGGEPDCEDDEAMVCAPVLQNRKTAGIWNPLADFADIEEDKESQNIRGLEAFYEAVHQQSSCGLPSVSWIAPNDMVSEHPTSLISTGQAYVTTLVNSIMRSRCWGSTAIFLSWDDWGGFYDHVVPPVVGSQGYGFRVPGLVISPYAKAGYVDRQQLSHDAYLKFIEDDFLEGQRLNPLTDGRKDARPEVREEAPGLGNLAEDFDFSQPPRPPLLLPTRPAPGPQSCPPGSVPGGAPPPSPEVACPYTAVAPGPGAATPSANPRRLLKLRTPRRQSLSRHHGRIYVLLACNVACSLYAHGHLNLTRARHRLKLRGNRRQAQAGVAIHLWLSLSTRDLLAAERALRLHRRVYAAIEVDATGANGQRQAYRLTIRLIR